MLLTARWLQKDYGSTFITFFTFRLSILISYIKLFIIMLGVIITWELFKTNHSTFIAIVLFWLLSTIMQYTREKEIVAVCRMRRMRLQGIIKPANAKSFPAKKNMSRVKYSHQWRCSGVFIVNSEHVSHLFVVDFEQINIS